DQEHLWQRCPVQEQEKWQCESENGVLAFRDSRIRSSTNKETRHGKVHHSDDDEERQMGAESVPLVIAYILPEAGSGLEASRSPADDARQAVRRSSPVLVDEKTCHSSDARLHAI